MKNRTHTKLPCWCGGSHPNPIGLSVDEGIKGLNMVIDSLQEENKRYKEALEWIARSGKYAGVIDSGKNVARKMAAKAREALRNL